MFGKQTDSDFVKSCESRWGCTAPHFCATIFTYPSSQILAEENHDPRLFLHPARALDRCSFRTVKAVLKSAALCLYNFDRGGYRRSLKSKTLSSVGLMALWTMELIRLYLLQLAVIGVPWLVSAGQWDCLTAGDSCSSDEACSPRLRTLRQCVAGGGSVKLGPGARNHCENAVTALLASPLHRCQCKRGMKREKNCLSIYWSLKQSVIHGLNLVESYPYEPVERGFDYVRLASIAAESEAGMATVNHCLDAAKACNVDDTCQKLRTEYVSACIAPSVRAGACNRMRCNKALRKFFDRVPPDYTHELLFCPCSDTACSERRRQTIVPACSYEEREKPNCLTQLSSCEDDLVCKSRWAQFKHDCQPSELTASGCQQENYGACLVAYTGLIGTTITPNYLDNSTSNVGPWCSCAASGNHREQCYDFLIHFHDNICLKNAILAFGNDTDSKSAANQPGSASPRTNTPNQHLATSTITTTIISINAESQQNIFHPQIPTQMNERDRLLSDSTLPLPDLYDSSPGCTDLAMTAFLPTILLLAFHF